MSTAIKTLPALTVGTSKIPVASSSHKWASLSIQADPANTGNVFVGDVNVSTTQYARVLKAGDWLTVAGSAVDPRNTWVVSDAAAQVVHPSGT